MLRYALCAVAASLLIACGGDDSEPNQGGSGLGGSGGTGSCAALSTPYPAGPYVASPKVGDVFPELVWSGRVNPSAEGIATTKSIADYSSDDIRKTCKPFALVHISEFV